MNNLKKFLNNFKLNLNKKNKLIIIKYNKLIYNICKLLLIKKYIINIFWSFNFNNLYLILVLNINKFIKKIIFYKKNKIYKNNCHKIYFNIYMTNIGFYSYNMSKLCDINSKLFCTII